MIEKLAVICVICAAFGAGLFVVGDGALNGITAVGTGHYGLACAYFCVSIFLLGLLLGLGAETKELWAVLK